MDRVSERNYTIMREKYEKEQLGADNRLGEIGAELSAKGISDRSATDFVSMIEYFAPREPRVRAN